MLACAMNTPWVLWSNFFFFLGNIVYILSDLLSYECLVYKRPVFGRPVCDSDNDLGIYLSIIGAILFICNPVTDLLGTIAETLVKDDNERLTAANMERFQNEVEDLDFGGALEINDDLSRRLSDTRATSQEVTSTQWSCKLKGWEDVNWDLYVALIFLFASILYLCQAFMDLYRQNNIWYYHLISVLGAHLMVFDSCLGLVGWYVNRVEMKGSGRERYLCSFSPSQVDWSGLGDWLFFFGSLLDAYISYDTDDPEITLISLSLVSNLLWLLDSIFYILGSMFGQRVRRRFAEGYYTSLSHVEQIDMEDKKILRERQGSTTGSVVDIEMGNLQNIGEDNAHIETPVLPRDDI